MRTWLITGVSSGFGNINVGNDKETLVSAITCLCPYIGFPRTLNALSVVNEVCKNGE